MCNSDIGFVIAQEEIWHRTTWESTPRALRQASSPQAHADAPLPPSHLPRNPPAPRYHQASHRHPAGTASPHPQHHPHHVRPRIDQPRRIDPPQSIPTQPAAPQAIPPTVRHHPLPGLEVRHNPPHRKASRRLQPVPAHHTAPPRHAACSQPHNPHTVPPCHHETPHQQPPSDQRTSQAPPHGANGAVPSTSRP